MESTECIAAHSTASTILLHSATITAATSSRTADSTPVGVSRSVAVVVMGLLNQRPPTVLRPLILLCTREPGSFGSRSARSRYARWRSLLDHRKSAPYSTAEGSAALAPEGSVALDHRVRRRARPPKAAPRSTSEGSAALDHRNRPRCRPSSWRGTTYCGGF